jgi:hypothetical protein
MSKRKKPGQKEIEELAKVIENIAPKKRQKKGRIGTVVSPDEIGVETRFKKGHRRPGPGRPSTTPMRDALRKRLLSKFPAKYSESMGIPKGITWGEAVALTSLYDMVKSPEPAKFTAYAAESDGPLPTEISGPQGGPIPMDVNVNDKLAVVAGRLRDRLAKRDKPA